MINEFNISINLKFTDKAELVRTMQEQISQISRELSRMADEMETHGDKTVQLPNGTYAITNGVWAGWCAVHGDVWVSGSTLRISDCPKCGSELLPF